MLTTLVMLSLAAPPLFTLTGKAEVSHPWCGGAMPSPSQRERRLPETQKYVVKPGDKNSEAKPVATIAPKADGSFSVKLPAGKWCVVDEGLARVPPSKSAKEPPPPGTPRAVAAGGGTPDFVCLDAVWAECEQVIEVVGPPKEPLSLTRYVPCSWNVRCPNIGESRPPPPP
jgi:hypothetical protein